MPAHSSAFATDNATTAAIERMFCVRVLKAKRGAA